MYDQSLRGMGGLSLRKLIMGVDSITVPKVRFGTGNVEWIKEDLANIIVVRLTLGKKFVSPCKVTIPKLFTMFSVDA